VGLNERMAGHIAGDDPELEVFPGPLMARTVAPQERQDPSQARCHPLRLVQQIFLPSRLIVTCEANELRAERGPEQP
jgi:hypothetical protein